MTVGIFQQNADKLKRVLLSPGWEVQLVRALFRSAKDSGFIPDQGTYKKQPLRQQVDVSLSLSNNRF